MRLAIYNVPLMIILSVFNWNMYTIWNTYISGIERQQRITEPQWVAKNYKRFGTETEVRLPCGARCDIVGPRFATEVDWCKKWAEGVGQSLYYAAMLNKDPQLVLLSKDPRRDKQQIARAKYVCQKYNITLWIWRL